MDEKIRQRREKENRDLIERMKRGEPLNRLPPEATWFPPRPSIAKNKKDIERVYSSTINNPEKFTLHCVIGDTKDDTTETS
jgi:hypothetical protein